MSVNLSFIGGAGWQFFDDNGVILSGGKIYTYAAGTTTPQATYTSRTGLTANTNPIVLDAYGRTPEQVWSTEGLLYKYVVAKSNDVVLRTWDNIGGSVVSSNLAADLAASSGSSLVGYLPAGTSAVATTVQTKLRESVSVKDFGAVGDGVTDDAAAIQAALTASRNVYIPVGAYRIMSFLTIPAGTTVYGAGRNTVIKAYGCDAFKIVGGSGDGITIQAMTMLSYTAGGVGDPKLYDAILCNGSSGLTVNNFVGRDLYLQGWVDCINWRYTWTSRLDNVSTVNCTNSVYVFGQSINNSISNCSLLANTGTASVVLDADGVIIGEGLTISNTLLASGIYGITGDDHLSLNISNCVLDLITSVGIYLLNPIALNVTNCWIYAANKGIYLLPLGAPSQIGATISSCYITTTAASSKGVHIDVNNVGVSVIGGSITVPATGSYPIHAMSNSMNVVGVNLVNPTALSSVYFEFGVNSNFVGCTGNTKFEFINGDPPPMGLPVAPFNTNLTYSTSITPNCLTGSQFSIVITNGTAFTINNPTNPPYLRQAASMTFAFFNLSGGAAGAITWGSHFKLAGAWVQPSDNAFRTISFDWLGGDRWAETSRITTDLPL